MACPCDPSVTCIDLVQVIGPSCHQVQRRVSANGWGRRSAAATNGRRTAASPTTSASSTTVTWSPGTGTTRGATTRRHQPLARAPCGHGEPGTGGVAHPQCPSSTFLPTVVTSLRDLTSSGRSATLALRHSHDVRLLCGTKSTKLVFRRPSVGTSTPTSETFRRPHRPSRTCSPKYTSYSRLPGPQTFKNDLGLGGFQAVPDRRERPRTLCFLLYR